MKTGSKKGGHAPPTNVAMPPTRERRPNAERVVGPPHTPGKIGHQSCCHCHLRCHCCLRNQSPTSRSTCFVRMLMLSASAPRTTFRQSPPSDQCLRRRTSTWHMRFLRPFPGSIEHAQSLGETRHFLKTSQLVFLVGNILISLPRCHHIPA